jgi:maltose/moltooligosaccharide transporter
LENTKKRKLNYPQTFLIGFGFLASSLAWSIYNSQVPLLLSERFLMTNAMIGTIMTIDNFFGVIFQPLVGAWSDNTRTRLGRRMPWIAIGLPVCAILFALIPLQHVLWLFMAVVIGFNLIMSLWRSPVISLMPDVTARPLRSQANGIINLMGGLGSILAFLVGGMLSDVREDKFYAFLFATIVMLFALGVLLLFVREPDSILYKKQKQIPIRDHLANRWAQEALLVRDETESIDTKPAEETKQRSLTAFLGLPRAEQVSLIALLFAIFSWFMGFNAIETFFTLFATNEYGITGGQATIMLTGFSLTFLAFALPAGLIGQRIGRKRTIRIGLVGIVVMFLPILMHPSQWLVQILLLGGGFFWACVNINSLPMVLEFASVKTIGSFTGYYYLFSFTAAIVSPILYGFLQDLAHSYSLLFVYAVICFAIAFVCMLFVRHGDNLELAVTEGRK